MVAGKQTVRRGGGGGLPSSGPSSLEVEDARPLLPGKPAARNGTVPSKAQMPSLRLLLCWSAMFAVFLLAFHTSLMVGTGRWPSGLCTGTLCLHTCLASACWGRWRLARLSVQAGGGCHARRSVDQQVAGSLAHSRRPSCTPCRAAATAATWPSSTPTSTPSAAPLWCRSLPSPPACGSRCCWAVRPGRPASCCSPPTCCGWRGTTATTSTRMACTTGEGQGMAGGLHGGACSPTPQL